MAERKKSTPLPRQEALFDDGPETNASALVSVAASAGPLSAAQRTFNRLTERIRRGRESLAAWEAFIPRFQSRLATELGPIEDQIRDAQRRFVQQLQALLEDKKGERLSRKHRARVRSLLLQILDELLQDGPDPELEKLYKRYGNVSHAEKQREELEMAEALFGGMFGPETRRGREARDAEEWLRHADEKSAGAEERAGNASHSRARRGGPSRAAERKAQAAREASLSVREIYRKLASALHPDREPDATERERKTSLIQRANQAYERNDLLELLSLQIETEQIDAGALASVPEARLGHYNQVLLDQARALEAEVQERVALFRVQFDLTTRDVTQQRVDQALSARIIQARAALGEMERDLKKLGDPRQRRSVLDNLPEADAPDFEDLAVLAAVFDEMSRPARPDARRRKRRRR